LIALFLIKSIVIHDWELIGWQLEKAKLLSALLEHQNNMDAKSEHPNCIYKYKL